MNNGKLPICVITPLKTKIYFYIERNINNYKLELIMKLKHTLTIVMILIAALVFGQDNNIKKITVVETNNSALNYDYQKLRLPDSIDTKEFRELKEYVLANITLKSTKEPEIYFELMEWVSQQWEHNGWHAAPDSLNSLGILKSAKYDKQQYRCVEYGSVLHDVLVAFGYVARTIGIKNSEVDYGGAGMAHVTTEVWSNNYNKWIFLDPQWDIYAIHNNIPLNIYDIAQLDINKQFNEIQFMQNGEVVKDSDYSQFLANYLGYVDINIKCNNLKYSLSLKLEGNKDYMTFQGFPTGKNAFTNEVSEVYFSLNQTMILFDYTDAEYNRSQEAYSKLEVKTLEDYNNNMYVFAAHPDFEITFDNNMPWFDHYKVVLNNKTVESTDQKWLIQLNTGINELEVVAVNKNGVEGVPTKMKISYE